MKKLICILLIACFLLPAMAYAAEAVTGITTGRVNVRSGPGTSYKALGKLSKGTTIQVLSTEGKWYKIEYKAQTGYVHSQYVHLGQKDTSSSTTSNIKGDYKKGSVYGPKLSTKELGEVKSAVEKAIKACITDNMDETEKLCALINYLCDVCSYAPDWSKNRANTAWGALVYGEAQCSGYARAFKALCDAAGIGCYYVHAAEDDPINPEHQWNIVSYKGQWYHVDVQMFDASYGRPILLMNSHLKYKEKDFPQIASGSIQLQ